ncbi:hypothetical protein WA026_008950 [Henosepilachna vigintioctopunctata]|uniref:Uncharacterized protein n=1 Tax=Henosepilachna vigintioctopunctata TaxID=420089 RepID=A0AAW1VDS4_9CUCU
MKIINCSILVLLFFGYSAEKKVSQNNPLFNGRTVITRNNVSDLSPKIEHKFLRKPHNLLIGRCFPHYEVLHQEHIVVKNDGRSHVDANIRINVDGPVNITCVSVFDEMDEENAYPIYSGGGVGYNYVSFNVKTSYGMGFHFFIKIFGVNTMNN